MSAEELFSKTRAALVWKFPLFGCLSMHLKPVEDASVPLAATDGRRLFYNPGPFEHLQPGQRLGLLAHEVLHCALGHVCKWRVGEREREKWNVAADHVVNLILRDFGLSLPEGGYCGREYRGLSAEEVYKILPRNVESRNDLILSEDAELEKLWREKLVQYSDLMGDQSRSLSRFVGKILHPRIPWDVLLADFLNELLRDDYDFSVPDRRFLSRGLCLPDLWGYGAYVACGLDSSGSMSLEDLQKGVSEFWGILSTKKVNRIRFLACDSEISLDREFTVHDPAPDVVEGGGGTSFVPIFDRLMESPELPDCLVYFTDLLGSFPSSPPPFPVFWVSPNEDVVPPFGRVIHYSNRE